MLVLQRELRFHPGLHVSEYNNMSFIKYYHYIMVFYFVCRSDLGEMVHYSLWKLEKLLFLVKKWTQIGIILGFKEFIMAAKGKQSTKNTLILYLSHNIIALDLLMLLILLLKHNIVLYYENCNCNYKKTVDIFKNNTNLF